MRPELAAFRELDTLVRNLSDQLAGYRRRALSAESRARELEASTDELRLKLEGAEAVAQRTTGELSAVRSELAVARSRPAAAPAVGASAVPSSPGAALTAAADDSELARENAELKTRLMEATAKARELNDRLRFLRQQMSTVTEK